jgi:hypothetical protein
MVYGKVGNGYTFYELRGSEKVVVKLSNDQGFEHELSIYLQADGTIEGRYFRKDGRSRQVFRGTMYGTDLDIFTPYNEEDLHDL